jgi:hypothetical protein
METTNVGADMSSEARPPKVNCRLVGEDGNAFAILGRFRAAARKAGWTPEQIEAVTQKATSGDYNLLLATIAQHCENP